VFRPIIRTTEWSRKKFTKFNAPSLFAVESHSFHQNAQKLTDNMKIEEWANFEYCD